jgi:hypothetical protein
MTQMKQSMMTEGLYEHVGTGFSQPAGIHGGVKEKKIVK